MEVCWCGCGAEWASDTGWEWAASDEWADYVEPVYAEPTYYEPIVYSEAFVTEPVYTEPVYTEPYVEAAPAADASIALVGGPTAGFDPVAMEPTLVADPGIAIVSGPSAGVTNEVTAFDVSSVPVTAANVAVIGGPAYTEFEIAARPDPSWDAFLNNSGTSGDPFIDQVINDGLSLTNWAGFDVSNSNGLTQMSTLGIPSSEFSASSSGRLVNVPYYNDY